MVNRVTAGMENHSNVLLVPKCKDNKMVLV